MSPRRVLHATSSLPPRVGTWAEEAGTASAGFRRPARPALRRELTPAHSHSVFPATLETETNVSVMCFGVEAVSHHGASWLLPPLPVLFCLQCLRKVHGKWGVPVCVCKCAEILPRLGFSKKLLEHNEKCMFSELIDIFRFLFSVHFIYLIQGFNKKATGNCEAELLSRALWGQPTQPVALPRAIGSASRWARSPWDKLLERQCSGARRPPFLRVRLNTSAPAPRPGPGHPRAISKAWARPRFRHHRVDNGETH